MSQRPNPDRTPPPISALHKPMYLMQMNWPRWSDAVRLRHLKALRDALLETLGAVNHRIHRMESARAATSTEPQRGPDGSVL